MSDSFVSGGGSVSGGVVAALFAAGFEAPGALAGKIVAHGGRSGARLVKCTDHDLEQMGLKKNPRVKILLWQASLGLGLRSSSDDDGSRAGSPGGNGSGNSPTSGGSGGGSSSGGDGSAADVPTGAAAGPSVVAAAAGARKKAKAKKKDQRATNVIFIFLNRIAGLRGLYVRLQSE